MGMATYIEQSVNNALDHYVVTSSDAVIGVLTPVAVTAVTLYVTWTGFQVMRGDVQEPVTALVWRWFRVALITGGKRIGGVVAEQLARGGADVALVYRSSRGEAEDAARHGGAADGHEFLDEAYGRQERDSVCGRACIDKVRGPFIRRPPWLWRHAPVCRAEAFREEPRAPSPGASGSRSSGRSGRSRRRCR